MTQEAWLLNAFCGEGAAGNATAVVFEEPGQEDQRWAVAQSLRVPDTVFVRPTGPEAFSLRFFSPQEGEMTFCGQGIIAADQAIRRKAGNSASELRLDTPAGLVRSTAESDVSWFRVSRSDVCERSCPSELAGIWPGCPCAVVDSGRSRVFVRLDAGADLQATHVEPTQVLELCSTHGLSGICFYVPGVDVNLRVFTVSLGGREDASTGGAVAGLARLLRPGRWMIHQGSGSRWSRGELQLDSISHESEIAVGGRVEPVLAGRLLC